MAGPEKPIKDYLKRQCEKRGWDCLPLELRTKPGWPDRSIFPGDVTIAFIETKSSETKHSKAHIEKQESCMRWLHERGFFAGFAVDKAGVDECLRMIEFNLYHGFTYTGASTFNAI